MAQQTAAEVIVVLVLRAAPAQLSHSEHTREGHVVQTLAGGYPLCPKVSLHTKHTILLGSIEVSGLSIIVVNLSQRLLAFIIVEIEGGIGCQDDVVAMAGGLLHGRWIPRAPPHDGTCGRKSSVNNLVPSYHVAAVLIEELLHLVQEPCLQFGFGLQPMLTHTKLTVRALLPIGHVNLIATNVDIMIGE